MENNISLVTYTNSNCREIWQMYFKQLDKFNTFESYVFSDVDAGEDFPNHKFILYKNEEPYYKQYLKCLENVEDEYIIYLQEDFVLYDKVNSEIIEHYRDILENSDYSYIRLIRTGFVTDLKNKIDGENLYKVRHGSKDDAFLMQATLWKKKDLIKLYETTKSLKWLEGDHWDDCIKSLNLKGLYYYNGEKKRGKYHWDSNIYPYICTAIVNGLWNLNEYGDIIKNLIKEYNINTSNKGERLDYKYKKERPEIKAYQEQLKNI